MMFMGRVRDGVVIPLGLGLTPREEEVVATYAKHWSREETARELGISPHTVRNHLASARRKAGATTTGELMLRLGWLKVPQ